MITRIRRLAQLRCFSSGKQLKQLLKQITTAGSNIVEEKMVEQCEIDELRKVRIVLSTAKDYRRIKADIIELLQSNGFKDVEIQISSNKNTLFEKHANLKNVKRILAVTGGHGRSHLSMSLARAFAAEGLKTGLLQAELVHPELPSAVPHPHNINDDALTPIEVDRVRCMSASFFSLRQPTSLMLNKLLLKSVWGQLDYLLIDASPKDMSSPALTDIKFQGAVVLKHSNSRQDFVGCLGLLTSRQIQLLGVALCEPLKNNSQNSTSESATRLSDVFGIKNILTLPEVRSPGLLDKEVTEFGRNCLKLLQQPPKRYIAHYNTTTQRMQIIQNGKVLKKLKPFNIRYSPTSTPSDPHLVDPQVFPVTIRPICYSAVEIHWSDGKRHCHYSFDRLLSGQSSQ